MKVQFVAATMVALISLASSATAQTIIHSNGHAVVVPNQIHGGSTQFQHVKNNAVVHPIQTHWQHGGSTGVHYHGLKPVIGWPCPRESVPHVVTTPHVTGWNQQTGGWNTGNVQINNTAYDYGRTQSLQNGTLRTETRPVYDQHGNVVGYEQGHYWNNSLTNQEHFEGSVVVPNQYGGFTKTKKLRVVKEREN